MTDVDGLKELYVTLGVGGLSFIVVLYILGHLLRQIFPMLQNVLQMMEVLKEVLQNNTKAIDEMAKSNQNVATALELLKQSMTTVESSLEKVKDSNEVIELNITKIDTKLEERLKRGGY